MQTHNRLFLKLYVSCIHHYMATNTWLRPTLKSNLLHFQMDFSHESQISATFPWAKTPNLVKMSLMLFNKANLRDLIAATGLVISNWIQIVNFSARVTVKFDGWPCKTMGHLFYATSSFVHHFVPIGEFKLEFQSGNAQFGSKSTIFLAVWPRNFTDDPQKQ